MKGFSKFDDSVIKSIYLEPIKQSKNEGVPYDFDEF
jgi:hypothetical protein